MSLKNFCAAFVVLLMVVVAPKAASAAPITFTCATNNSLICSTYADQITGDVTLVGNQLTILIMNGSPGVITDLYVDAPGTGTGYTFASFIESPDALVNFGIPGAPPDLNGGNPVGFNATHQFHAANPSPDNGAGLGEQIGLVFTVAPDQLTTIVADFLNGDLSVGFHLQSLPGNYSESMISDPGTTITTNSNTPVPEPASMLLLGTGLLAAARVARRRSKTS